MSKMCLERCGTSVSYLFLSKNTVFHTVLLEITLYKTEFVCYNNAVYLCKSNRGVDNCFMEKKEFDKNRPQSAKNGGNRKRYDTRPGYGADRGGRSKERYDPDRKPAYDAAGEEEEDTGLVIGRNAVRELLKSGRPVDKLYVAGREGSIVALVAEAKKAGVPVVETDTLKLDKMARGENHQGIIAQTAAREYSTIADILAIAAERGEMPLIVVCDGVEDPHNLGAIIRTAECCGAHGVVIPKRRACGLTAAVTKASAGAVEHMAVARVQNIASAIEELKEAGVWTFAAEADGVDFWDADFRLPCALVMGSEGNGVSRLVKERCDFLISIPMYGYVNSLNVSAATSILLAHAARKQRMG